MKSIKQLLSLAMFPALLIVIESKAQTVKDIFSPATPITYLGIDFSRAKLIGEAADPNDVKNKVYPSMNQVVINEPKKYEINKALSRSEVANDISITDAANSKIVVDSIKSYNTSDFQRYSASTIEQIISTYDFKGKTGIGLIFVMESMSKTQEKASIWATFVNMSNNKVLLTERLVEKAGGFGLRNYWVKTVAEAIEEIKKSKYKQWNATYNK